MAFPGKEILIALLMAAAARAEVRFEARHDHLRKGCRGTMVVDERGIAFTGPKRHAWRWRYGDIQELKLGPNHIHVLTYRDSRLRLGADRVYDFTGTVPDGIYPLWKKVLDQRFVAELADTRGKPLWSVPAKHLLRMGGSEGVIEICGDRIVYAADRKKESRTWRYQDIDNISTSGPFQLTITTFERAKFHYKDRKGFNFQLKQALSEARYDELWRKIQEENGRIQK